MEHPPSFDDGRPTFDHDLARELVGKYVLVGLTTVDTRGELKSQRQFHGRVLMADPRKGIRLALAGNNQGKEYGLPPDTRAFERASPGTYRLYETGESVENPDFTCSWTLTQNDA